MKKPQWLQDFQDFAFKGNLIDIAVAMVPAVAFGALISSFVTNILMPPVGLLLGHTDFSNLFINLGSGDYATLADAQEAGVPVIAYGLFITSTINFLFLALSIFFLIRIVTKMKKGSVQEGD